VLFEGAVDFQIAPVLMRMMVMIVGLASKALENFSSELRRASSARLRSKTVAIASPTILQCATSSSDQVTGRAWESKPTAPAITPAAREWEPAGWIAFPPPKVAAPRQLQRDSHQAY